MKAYEIQDDFGLDNLTMVDRPDPKPGPGEIKLDMKAVSLNYRDLMTIKGHYDPSQPLPLIPLSDGVGEVVEIGENVSRVEVGDRVAPIFFQSWLDGTLTFGKRRSALGGPLDGTLCETMVLSEDGVVHAPDHLTDEEVAALPCAGVTAWNALTRYRPLRAGDTVLLEGTGGVSIFALQFAKLFGARVIITSSSDEKLEKTRELGADVTINYESTPDWDKAVREQTDNGVDVVVEVGGGGTLQKALSAAAPEAQVSVIGVLSGGVADLSVIPILNKTLRVQGIYVGAREDFEAMNRALATNDLHPFVDRVFDFDQTRDALEYMDAQKHFGKVVVRVASD